MAFIGTISVHEAIGKVAEIYETDRQDSGYVANYTKIFAHRPDVYEAWGRLKDSIKPAMGARRYELATLAAAQQLRSSYCALAHGKILRDAFFDAATVRNLALDHHTAGLGAAETAIMDFATRIAADATSVTQAHIDELRGHGLSDGEILDVALAAAARCFFTKVLDAMGAEPDAAYQDLEPELRDALTVGRPIAAA